MGALGRVYGNGDLDLALTIRTFAIAEGRIHLWVGGGVVWDSDPDEEVEESWTKADPFSRQSVRRSRGCACTGMLGRTAVSLAGTRAEAG